MWTANSLVKTLILGRLSAGGEGEDRRWDGWRASLTQWTRVWPNSGRWWKTGKPGVLQSVGSQRVKRLNSWVQFSSIAQSCLTLCSPTDCRTPGLPIHHQLLPEPAQTQVHWVGNAIQPSHPLSSPSPPAFNLSQHQGLSQWVGSLHQGARVLELRLQHQSFHEYSGLIFFRIDWFDLLAVQGTLKSLLQHNSKASVLWHSAFFMVQLSHLYMTTGKP